MFDGEYYTINVIGEESSIIEFEEIIEGRHSENLHFNRIYVSDKTEPKLRNDGRFEISFSGYAKWSLEEGFLNGGSLGCNSSHFTHEVYDSPLITESGDVYLSSSKILLNKLLSLKSFYYGLEKDKSTSAEDLAEKELIMPILEEKIKSLKENENLDLGNEVFFYFDTYFVPNPKVVEWEQEYLSILKGHSSDNIVNIIDVSKAMRLTLEIYSVNDNIFCSDYLLIKNGEVLTRELRPDTECEIEEYYGYLDEEDRSDEKTEMVEETILAQKNYLSQYMKV